MAVVSLGFLAPVCSVPEPGGAKVLRPIIRVTFWGGLAMALTAAIGAFVGTVV